MAGPSVGRFRRARSRPAASRSSAGGLERGRPRAVAQQRHVPDAAAREVEDDAVGRRVVAGLADQLDDGSRARGGERDARRHAGRRDGAVATRPMGDPMTTITREAYAAAIRTCQPGPPPPLPSPLAASSATVVVRCPRASRSAAASRSGVASASAAVSRPASRSSPGLGGLGRLRRLARLRRLGRYRRSRSGSGAGASARGCRSARACSADDGCDRAVGSELRSGPIVDPFGPMSAPTVTRRDAGQRARGERRPAGRTPAPAHGPPSAARRLIATAQDSRTVSRNAPTTPPRTAPPGRRRGAERARRRSPP